METTNHDAAVSCSLLSNGANRRRTGVGLLLCTTLATGAPGIAFAQTGEATPEAATEAAPAQPSESEIVVTALKSGASSLQETPATVQVVDQAQLTAKGVVDIQQISSAIPSIQVAISPVGNPTFTLRGLGTFGATATADQAMGLFFNGVYVAHGKGFATAVYDMAQVEVVKGTEAAILGKNTSIGAIAMTTNAAKDSFGGSFTGRYDSRRSGLANAALNIPLGDTLSLRVAGLYSRERGWVKNLANNVTGPDSKTLSGRISVRWEPTDNFDASLFFQADRREVDGSALEPIAAPVQESIAAALGLSGYETTLNDRILEDSPRFGPYRDHQSIQRAIGKMNYRFDNGMVLTSTSGWSHYDDDQVSTNIDHVVGGIFEILFPERNTTYSQELLLISAPESPVQWTLGGSYLNDDWQLDRFNYSDPALGQQFLGFDFGETDLLFHQQYSSVAVFGRADYDINDKLNIFGALRYSREKKHADIGIVAQRPGFLNRFGDTDPDSATPGVYTPFPVQRVSRTEQYVDGSLGLKYKLNEDVMLYASAGKGTKAGGFTNEPAPSIATAGFSPEVAWSQEIGAKIDLRAFGGSGYLNIAGFNTDVYDFQTTITTGVQILFFSRDLRSRGVDLDLLWDITPKLSLGVQTVYAHVRDKTADAPFFFAPKWSGSANLTYKEPLSTGLTFSSTFGLDYRTGMETVIAPKPPGLEDLTHSPGFTRINLSATVASDAGWRVSVIGDNLNNRRPILIGFPGFLSGAVLGRARPRSVALQFGYNF